MQYKVTTPLPEARPNIRHPRYGYITQGTIFCCATAAYYTGCQVYGLTITARCDIAQNKYSILNYLPIVKLGDWFLRDGLDILSEQEIAYQYGKLKGMLRQANLDPILINLFRSKASQRSSFPSISARKRSRKRPPIFVPKCKPFVNSNQ